MKAVYQVEGMTCGGCARAVTKAISADGTLQVRVDLPSGRVEVEGEHEPADLRARVERAGFVWRGAALP